uniref:Uncharacterized protein n=1 Tax=Rhizophora mucronata TaxID=61149 RepID=A0A2P2J3Q3_RHIMU
MDYWYFHLCPSFQLLSLLLPLALKIPFDFRLLECQHDAEMHSREQQPSNHFLFWFCSYLLHSPLICLSSNLPAGVNNLPESKGKLVGYINCKTIESYSYASIINFVLLDYSVSI